MGYRGLSDQERVLGFVFFLSDLFIIRVLGFWWIYIYIDKALGIGFVVLWFHKHLIGLFNFVWTPLWSNPYSLLFPFSFLSLFHLSSFTFYPPLPLFSLYTFFFLLLLLSQIQHTTEFKYYRIERARLEKSIQIQINRWDIIVTKEVWFKSPKKQLNA